jgi:hypothetical protein
VPADPKIHDRDSLSCLLHGRVPFSFDGRRKHPHDLAAREKPLRLIRPEKVCPDSSGNQGLDMAKHENISRLVQAQPDDAANDTKERREVGRYRRQAGLVVVPGRGPQRPRVLSQGRVVLTGGPSNSSRRRERALPDAQQGAPLCCGGALPHGAHDRRIEVIVQLREPRGFAVRRQDEGQGGGCVGRD